MGISPEFPYQMLKRRSNPTKLTILRISESVNTISESTIYHFRFFSNHTHTLSESVAEVHRKIMYPQEKSIIQFKFLFS